MLPIFVFHKTKADTTKSKISHRGFVTRVSDKALFVNILNESACSSCHAKGTCIATDTKEKEIEISVFRKNYSPGQEVTVTMNEKNGFRAVGLGYGIPFIILTASLIIFKSLNLNDLMAGLLSICMLVPYYIALYFFRENLKQTFTFEIEE